MTRKQSAFFTGFATFSVMVVLFWLSLDNAYGSQPMVHATAERPTGFNSTEVSPAIETKELTWSGPDATKALESGSVQSGDMSVGFVDPLSSAILFADADYLYLFPLESGHPITIGNKVAIPPPMVASPVQEVNIPEEWPLDIVVSDNYSFLHGIVSPDGLFLTYVEAMCDDHSCIPPYNAWLVKLSNHSRTLIASDKMLGAQALIDPVGWSDQTARIIFDSFNGEDGGAYQGVWIYDLQSELFDQIDLGRSHYNSRLWLSPDGFHLVFTGSSSPQTRDYRSFAALKTDVIKTLDLQTLEVDTLLQAPPDHEYYLYGWLSDRGSPAVDNDNNTYWLSDLPDEVPPATSGFQRPMTNDHYGYTWLQWTGVVYHPADDYNGPGSGNADCDTDIQAVANGTVRYWNPGGWGTLVVEHLWQGITVYSQYGHLGSALVNTGQNVSKGQHIAEMGHTGTETCHLHWEIREADHPEATNGSYWNTTVLSNLANVQNYYEDPEWWVDNHPPYGSNCTPNSDQVALFVDPDYSGQCVIRGTGDYPNPSSIGLPNDSISSVRVGGNVRAILCRDDGFQGGCETFTSDDPNLGDNSIGDNQVSSARVELRSGGSCYPSADQVALFVDANYGGQCVVKTVDDYTNPGAIGLPNDSVSSVRVGANVRAILCRNDGFQGGCETFTGDDPNLSDNGIGDNQVSSAQVLPRSVNCPTITAWRGEYWNNDALGGSTTLCRNDGNINFEWLDGSPDPIIQAETFSARWTRVLSFSAGQYRFTIFHDDGARLYVDSNLVFQNWCENCSVTDTVDVTLSSGNHEIKMEMRENSGWAAAQLSWEPLATSTHTPTYTPTPTRTWTPTPTPTRTWTPTPTPTRTWTPTPTPTTAACPAITAWKGEYWNNETLSGPAALCRNDTNIDFDWYEGSPAPVIQPDHFSARWTRDINFSAGSYRFEMFHDDGVRLIIDGVLVFQNWCDNCRQTDTFDVTLPNGMHNIKMEMREYVGWAAARLTWQPLATSTPTPTRTGVPSPTPTPTRTRTPTPTPTRTTGVPSPTPTPTRTRTPTPTTIPSQFVWFREAENAEVVSPMFVADDDLASNCHYVHDIHGWSGGYVRFAFNAPATGNYYTWARVKGLEWTRNSFFVSVDNGAEFQYEFEPFNNQWIWGWDQVHPYQQPVSPFWLQVGPHEVRFVVREAYSRLDGVAVTNDAAFVPTFYMPCSITATPTPTPTAVVPPSAYWRAEFYNNETLSGTPVLVRNDSAINFDWAYNSPAAAVNSDHFSARWVRTVQFTTSGNYRFHILRDDGARLRIDNSTVLNEWRWGHEEHTVDYYVSAGSHTVQFEVFEIDGWARAGLSWQGGAQRRAFMPWVGK